jgi:hypothetical protein
MKKRAPAKKERPVRRCPGCGNPFGTPSCGNEAHP